MKYDLHSMQVSEWKKALQEHSARIFITGSRRALSVEAEEERTRQELHAKVGEQAVVIDWLKKVQASRSDTHMKELIGPDHADLRVRKQ